MTKVWETHLSPLPLHILALGQEGLRQGGSKGVRILPYCLESTGPLSEMGLSRAGVGEKGGD